MLWPAVSWIRNQSWSPATSSELLAVPPTEIVWVVAALAGMSAIRARSYAAGPSVSTRRASCGLEFSEPLLETICVVAGEIRGLFRNSVARDPAAKASEPLVEPLDFGRSQMRDLLEP